MMVSKKLAQELALKMMEWEKFWNWLLENIDVNLSIKYKPNSPCFDMRELLERKYNEYHRLATKEIEDGTQTRARANWPLK